MEETAKEKRESLKFGKALRAYLAESLYIGGFLKKEDFEDPKVINKKIKKYFDDLKKRGEEISFVIDHQPSILKEAEKSLLREDFELAYVFFATYFEHLINGVIERKCLKEKISIGTYKELVRRASLEDKFTWVLEILKLPEFSKSHRKVIKIVSERRNSFIHYKYQPQSNDPYNDEKEWEGIKKELKAAIKYSKNYQTRTIYEGKAKKLRLFKPE